MAHAAVAADLHQALDVQAHVAAQVALHLQVVLDVFTDLVDVLLREILHAGVRVDAGGGQDLLRGLQADAENIRQSDFDPLLTRQVNARNTCHCFTSEPNSVSMVFCLISL